MHTLDLHALRTHRDKVIGAPTAKLDFIHSGDLQPLLQTIIHSPPSLAHSLPYRTEATHILASIAREPACLPVLLRAGALRVLLAALRGLPHALPPGAWEEMNGESEDGEGEGVEGWTRGLVRALAELVGVMNEAVFGPRNGLGRARYEGRVEAAAGLDELYQISSLDTFLTLLLPPSPPSANLAAASLHVAHIVAATRSPEHRAAVLAWLPPAERLTAAKGKRGWERKEEGGWVPNRLIGMLKLPGEKAQIASTLALASLLDKNPALVTTLGRFHAQAAQRMFDLSRARSPDVRLAACTALTAILRHPRPTPKPLLRSASPDPPPPGPSNLLLNVLGALNTLLEDLHNPLDLRVRACWCLSTLVADDPDRAQTAHSVGSLALLATIVRSWPPIDTSNTDELEEEAHALCRFREAGLTAIASMTLNSQELRTELVKLTPPLLPIVHASLAHPSPLVRHAACQVIRALSRSVSNMRSSLVDEGVAGTVLGLVLRAGDVAPDPTLSGIYTKAEWAAREANGGNGKEKEREREGGDRRVLIGALMALSNFVTDCSPMQGLVREQDAIGTLIGYAGSRTDALLRLNALWVLKNLVYRADWELKAVVAEGLGWERLKELLQDEEIGVREQAMAIARNMAAGTFKDVQLTVDALGAQFLLNIIVDAMVTGNPEIQLQALYLLCNILPNIQPLNDFFPPPSPAFIPVLLSLHSPPASQPLRLAAVKTDLALISYARGAGGELVRAGFEKRIREMLGEKEGGPGGSGSGNRSGRTETAGMRRQRERERDKERLERGEGEEESLEVRDEARKVFGRFEMMRESRSPELASPYDG